MSERTAAYPLPESILTSIIYAVGPLSSTIGSAGCGSCTEAEVIKSNRRTQTDNRPAFAKPVTMDNHNTEIRFKRMIR